MRRPCFPNSGSHQHGPPLLGRVRAPLRSPTSTLLCSPPTPSSPFGRRSGRPSPAAYPGAEVLFFTAAPVPPLTGATPETFLPRLPISRLSPEEKRGDPRCLGHPLRACRGHRPRRVRTAPHSSHARPRESVPYTAPRRETGGALPSTHVSTRSPAAIPWRAPLTSSMVRCTVHPLTDFPSWRASSPAPCHPSSRRRLSNRRPSCPFPSSIPPC